MLLEELEIPGVKLLTPKVFADERGYFVEVFSKPLHEKFSLPCFVQENHSYSKRGTLRGMHFQKVPGQDKLVFVPHGKIFDVVVDMRPSSRTFKKWLGVFLDDKAQQQLFIPKGCAHGFFVVSDYAHVLYKLSALYDPLEEAGFRWNDKEIGIIWPDGEYLLSLRDQKSPFFKELLL